MPSSPRPAGDESDLFRAHHGALVRSLTRALKIPEAVAEDAASHAWIVLLRKQPERDRIVAWLWVVAVRQAVRIWDAEAENVVYAPDDGDGQALASMDLALQARELLEAVGDLERAQRRVLVPLAAGFSYEEVARATGLSCSEVDWTARRARLQLRLDLGLSLKGARAREHTAARRQKSSDAPAVAAA